MESRSEFKFPFFARELLEFENNNNVKMTSTTPRDAPDMEEDPSSAAYVDENQDANVVRFIYLFNSCVEPHLTPVSGRRG